MLTLYSFVVHLADATSLAPLKPRTPQSIGLFPYDGNIIGGFLIGVGMALTGACPGTVFVQAGAGIPSGIYVLSGGILGGLAFVLSQPILTKLRNSGSSPSKSQASSLTMPKSFNVSPWIVLAAWEAMCFTILKLISGFESQSPQSLVSPVTGGLLIGCAQAAALILVRHTIGTSGAFEDIGRFIRTLFSNTTATKSPLTASVLFDAGIVSASALLARFYLPGVAAEASRVLVSPAVAFTGGVVMAFGSRLAGGCTSGHGISGLATFSWASLVSVVSMFAAGVLTAALT